MTPERIVEFGKELVRWGEIGPLELVDTLSSHFPELTYEEWYDKVISKCDECGKYIDTAYNQTCSECWAKHRLLTPEELDKATLILKETLLPYISEALNSKNILLKDR